MAAAFGRFVARTRYDDLPPDVADAVKLRVLDVLAASCSGVLAGHHHGLLRLLSDEGRHGIWGTRHARSLRDAVIVNSAVAHSTYFEDGSRYTGGHPSSAVIPAAMALAAARGASSRMLIAAIANGYEVFLRLGRAIYPATVRRGFQSTAILAAPATAAAAATLLELPADRAAHAIAIACSHGAGLKAALKSADSQPLQVGRSSEGGLLAALYAEQGATGAPDIFETGFFPAFAGTAEPEPVSQDLGARWSIGETYMKAHGGCRGNHAPMDAVADVLASLASKQDQGQGQGKGPGQGQGQNQGETQGQNPGRSPRPERTRSQGNPRDRSAGILPDRIARIDVKVDTVTYAAAIEPPRNGDQAQFSIAFSIAVMLVAGDATPGRYTDAMLADERIRALMSRIAVTADPALDDGYPDRRPALVSIVLTDGRTLRHALDHAKGEPENPMTREDIARKFDTVAAPLYGADGMRIRDAVLALEHAPTLDDLAALLVSGSAPFSSTPQAAHP